MTQLLGLLANNLWEGAVIALAAWAVLRTARDANATTRYAVWSCALAATLILPIATTLAVGKPAPVTTTDIGAKDFSLSAIPANFRVTHIPSVSTAPKQSAPVKSGFVFGRVFVIPQNVVWGILGLWAALGALQLMRFFFALVALERLKRNATPMPIDYRERLPRWNAAESERSNVRLCVSDDISVPIAVGLFDAMILVPQGLLEQLPDDDVDRILLHEMTHLRRGDDWIHALQRLVMCVCFFNPALAYIARQMDLEREVSCDDSVLERDGLAPLPYATCLTKMAEIVAWPYRPLAAPGAFDTRRSLSIRVERLLTSARNNRTRIAVAPALAAVFVIGAAGAAGAAVSSNFSFALPALCRHAAQNAPVVRPVIKVQPIAHVKPIAVHPLMVHPVVVHPIVSVHPIVAVHPAVTVQPHVLLQPHVVVHPAVTVAPQVRVHPAITVPTVIVPNVSVDRVVAVSEPAIVAGNASSDPNTDYITELANAGYKGLSIEELVRLRAVGVDADYIRGIEAAGFPHPSTRELVQLRATGVTPAIIAELRRQFGALSLHDFSELHAVGVSGDYVDALARAGYRNLSARQILQMRAVNVDPAYIESLSRAGYSGLTASQLSEMRAMQIDSDYINKVRAHGFANITIRQLIELKASGIL